MQFWSGTRREVSSVKSQVSISAVGLPQAVCRVHGHVAQLYMATIG